MGGAVAALLAITRPPQVRGLVLSGPGRADRRRRLSHAAPVGRAGQCRLAHFAAGANGLPFHLPRSGRGRGVPKRSAGVPRPISRPHRSGDSSGGETNPNGHGPIAVAALDSARHRRLRHRSEGEPAAGRPRRLGRQDLAALPGLYHEVFSEPERDQVVADLLAWLDARR